MFTPEDRMDEVTALHTAARRHCEERFREWLQLYRDLQRTGAWQVRRSSKAGWDYSKEAWRTFPRYMFAKNTRIEIERIWLDRGLGPPEMEKAIRAAADKAEADLWTQLTNTLAREAVYEEAEDFRAYLRALGPEQLARVKPLPYRRVLGKEESGRLWSSLKRAWGVGSGHWFPLKEGPMPQGVLAFHTDYFHSISGQKILRDILGERGVSRVLLLSEFLGDPDYEIEIGLFEPGKSDGGEQYSTSLAGDWIVYTSHESSITVGGEWLVGGLRRLHPECAEPTYNGPCSTPDLRGTWETG